ncbi:MAG TPA: LacI family DNA-binding transcriptional regulator [Acidothermaceae bacterium]|jgi:LacI family transcriptional regulator
MFVVTTRPRYRIDLRWAWNRDTQSAAADTLVALSASLWEDRVTDGRVRQLPTTRAEVASRAQVSPAVVSYVLNDGPRPVAPATRERVLKAIQELGYRPNAVARALVLRRTETIGLVVPDNSNPYFAELAKAIEDVAYSAGYAMVLGNSSNDSHRESAQLRTLSERQVDGLLFIGSSSHPDLSRLRGSGIPVVLLDRTSDDDSFPSVVVDNRAGARAGVEHLIRHGHRRVACIGGPEDLPAAAEREAGWRQALRTHRIARAGVLERSPFSRAGGYAATRRLLSSDERPSAIFASSDLQGIGALRACHEAGLRVPDDVALLAFDGTQESEYTTPPLSVICQPVNEIAARSLEILLADDGQQTRGHVVLQPTLKLRRSCGCSSGQPTP